MKKIFKKWKNQKGFTLVEMIIVLFIISLISLVFIPNIVQTKAKVEADAKKSLTTVIKTQSDLYQMQNSSSSAPSLDELESGGYINKEQYEQAIKWEIVYP